MSLESHPKKILSSLARTLQFKQSTGCLPDYVFSSVRGRPILSSEEKRMPPSASSSKKTQYPPLNPQALPPLPPDLCSIRDPGESLKTLFEAIKDCKRCRLHQGRTHLVFGEGNPKARLMFIGEAPGKDEDLQGLPFVGKAGQLLTKIIEAMGFKRKDVYIANIIKSRPPENRRPAPDEIGACSPYIVEQIRIIQPELIVCLGNIAVQTLLHTEETITKLRGKLHRWPSPLAHQALALPSSILQESIQLMPTYHPAYLLRNPEMKKPVWEDMKIVMKELGLEPKKG